MHENFAPAVFSSVSLVDGSKEKNKHSFLHCQLGGGFKYVLFSPLFGEDFQFD